MSTEPYKTKASQWSFSPRTGKQPFYCFFCLITVDIFCFGRKTVFDRFRSLNHREGLKALAIKRNITLGSVVILDAVVKYYTELYIRHDLGLEVIGDRITDTPAIVQRSENLYHPKWSAVGDKEFRTTGSLDP